MKIEKKTYLANFFLQKKYEKRPKIYLYVSTEKTWQFLMRIWWSSNSALYLDLDFRFQKSAHILLSFLGLGDYNPPLRLVYFAVGRLICGSMSF